MGLVIVASLVCDKDLVNTAPLQSPDSPIPDGWIKVQGYVNGASENEILGFFCPVCVGQYGVNSLVKTADDLSIPADPQPSQNQSDAPVIP